MSHAFLSDGVGACKGCGSVSLWLFVGLFLLVSGCKKGDDPISPPQPALRYLVYSDHFKITRISEDGALVQDLTGSLGAQEGPKCAPDGSWIAYYSNTAFTGEAIGVYVMHQDGSAKTRLTDVAAQGVFFPIDLRWSADSKTIFFASPKGVPNQIYSVSPVAGAIAQKITNGDFAVNPRPSPTLAYLAYWGSYQGIVSEYIQHLNTSAPPRPLLATGRMGTPQWSPGGNLLCFGADTGSVVNLQKADVFTCQPDGSALVRLTNDGSSSVREFSPDGRRILFFSWTDGKNDLCLMNIDGSAKTTVTSASNFINNAHFSFDGSRLAFNVSMADTSVFTDLYTVNLDGSNLKKIASQCEADFSWCK